VTQNIKIDHHATQVVRRATNSVTITGFINRFHFNNLMDSRFDDPIDTDFLHRIADTMIHPIKTNDYQIAVTVTIER
jgi:hypothetical protein